MFTFRLDSMDCGPIKESGITSFAFIVTQLFNLKAI